MARKSFSIHMDFFCELRLLSNEQLGSLMIELINWAEDKEVSCSDPVCAILFRLMTAQIERISQANSANGSKGGRPPKTEESEETEKSEEKRIKPPVTNTVTNTVSDTNNITTDVEDVQIKNKQIKQGKYGNMALSADKYSKLLSEFGESTVSHYLSVVDEWANTLPNGDKIKNADRIIRKAIAEQWGGNNTVKKTNANTTRTEADYDEPFIRRCVDE